MDTSGDQKLDFEEFRQTLVQLDKKLKSLPATAQVASQQVIFRQVGTKIGGYVNIPYPEWCPKRADVRFCIYLQ